MILSKQQTHGWNQRRKEPPVIQFLILLLCLAVLAFVFSAF